MGCKDIGIRKELVAKIQFLEELEIFGLRGGFISLTIYIYQAGEIIEQALAHDLEIDEEETDQDFEDGLTEDEDLEDNLEEELSETEEDDFPLENKYTGDSV